MVGVALLRDSLRWCRTRGRDTASRSSVSRSPHPRCDARNGLHWAAIIRRWRCGTREVASGLPTEAAGQATLVEARVGSGAGWGREAIAGTSHGGRRSP
jgi:hypothetical protein